MNKEEIYNYCVQNLKCSDIKKDEPMSKHTSFKIGGNADIFIKISNIEELKLILKFIKENKINLTIIGNGSNVLVKDNGIRGIVLKLDFKNINIEKINNQKVKVYAGAGVSLGMLAQKLLKESISGFEFASGIPGTIGGAVRMNAGAYGGEFKDIVNSTKCIDEDGNIITLNNNQQEFSYRHSIFMSKKVIILESELLLNLENNSEEIAKKMNEYLETRKSKQPINLPNAGSTFKRGEDYITAKLIDECGLKGFFIGEAQISNIHAGFVVNKGNATAEDVLNLIEYVKKKVYEKFNKEIKLEIEVLGE
ncbi:MAG: UDP-N-acetylmuramate dehydrogenase [Clostridia bacterium]|nr:UDP-N-acetylmuramate dehydrogenase [Clostridia bacterium]